MIQEQLTLFEEDTDFSMKLSHKPNKQLEELYNYATSKAKECWNREFDIEIKLVAAKWTRMQGAYYVDPDKPFIKMSSIVNARSSKEEVFGTLLHEMVHWHLHTSGKPFRDDELEFALECIRIGAPFSSTEKALEVKKRAEILLDLQK